MPLTDPAVGKSEKFSDHFREGERFYLVGIRTVRVNTQDYGEGDMVLLKIEQNGEQSEYGVWGKYLVAQAESADHTDLKKWYVINRRVVPGFGSRAVKVLDPYAAPGQDDEPPADF